MSYENVLYVLHPVFHFCSFLLLNTVQNIFFKKCKFLITCTWIVQNRAFLQLFLQQCRCCRNKASLLAFHLAQMKSALLRFSVDLCTEAQLLRVCVWFMCCSSQEACYRSEIKEPSGMASQFCCRSSTRAVTPTVTSHTPTIFLR